MGGWGSEEGRGKGDVLHHRKHSGHHVRIDRTSARTPASLHAHPVHAHAEPTSVAHPAKLTAHAHGIVHPLLLASRSTVEVWHPASGSGGVRGAAVGVGLAVSAVGGTSRVVGVSVTTRSGLGLLHLDLRQGESRKYSGVRSIER